MNYVKRVGLVILAVAGVNIYTAGSLFVTVPLVIIGIWVYGIGGLSE